TYSLPCAHMLLQYRSQHMPIRLSAIDSQWRQLNLVPPIGNGVVFDYLPQLEILKDKWHELTEIEKLKITETLTELVQPDKTHLQEPSQPVATKGRKTAAEKKNEQSTKRNLITHERLEAQLGKKVTTVSTSKTNDQEGPKLKRKYTKKATEYWENKKTKKSVVELPFKVNEEVVKEKPNVVNENEHDVANLSFEATEKVVTLVDEQTIYRSRYKEEDIIDLTVVDYEMADLSVSMYKRPRTNHLPNVSHCTDEEEEDWFEEDKLNTDPDYWQLKHWHGTHNSVDSFFQVRICLSLL
ncbi:hypothetical protein MKX01_029016, partial [Papaver californicum]